MSGPVIARNKRTGEVRVSDDGGATWHAPEPQPGMGDVHTAEAADERASNAQKAQDIGGAFIPGQAPLDRGGVNAAVRGTGQGASVGFGDEAAGAGSWLAGMFGGGETPRAAGRGIDAPLVGEQKGPDPLLRHMFEPRQRAVPTDYTVARDAERGANAQAKQQHPYLYAGGEMVGSTAPAMLLGAGGGAAAKAAGAGRMLTAAGTGAALGGAEGAGRSEADSPQGVARDAAVGAGVGGALGVGGELAAPYVAKGARWLGDKLEGGADTLGTMADEQKLAAAGAERGALRKLKEKPGGLERYAEGAERLGIGRNRLGFIPATTRQHVADAETAAAAAGATKDQIAGQLQDAAVAVDGRDVAAAIRKLAAGEGKGPAGKAVRDEVEAIAQGFEAMGVVPFGEMNAELQSWGQATNFDAGSLRQNLRKKIYSAVNDSLSDAAERAAEAAPTEIPLSGGLPENVELPSTRGTVAPPRGKRIRGQEQIGQAATEPAPPEHVPATTAIAPPAQLETEMYKPVEPGLGKAWRSAKEDEHIARKLLELGENKLNTAGNRALSPTDYAAGAGGFALGGDPVSAGAAVLANKALRSREHAIAHQVLRGGESALGAGARGAQAVAGALEAAPASARGAATEAVLGREVQSAASPAFASDDEDPKYGPMLAAEKDPQKRALAVAVLSAQDPDFRSRRRQRAMKAEQ